AAPGKRISSAPRSKRANSSPRGYWPSSSALAKARASDRKTQRLQAWALAFAGAERRHQRVSLSGCALPIVRARPPQPHAMNNPIQSPQADVEIITLGCRHNAAESEGMRQLASEAGLGNAVIVNTCAVTNEAVRQARQAIRRARRERPHAEIIVTGCAAQ